MYVPRHFAMPPELLQRVLAAPLAGDLITSGPDGLTATHLPYLYDPEPGEHGRLVLHVARPNPQWRVGAGVDALFLITPATDYVSSLWYPSASSTGKYVPTWDYASVQLHGRLTAHDDLDWVTDAVARLMARHEDRIGLADMPDDYLSGQLRAIVGLELLVTRVEAKAKLSQNRSPEDVRGVIDNLRANGADELADLVAEFGLPPAEARADLVASVAARHAAGPHGLSGGRLVGTPQPRLD